jgi:uncharacterized protein YceK
MKPVWLAIFTALLSGCASHLVITDAKDQVASGVPFNVSVLVKINTTTRYERTAIATDEQAKFCQNDNVEMSIEALPLGERFYANISPAIFADGEFGMEFNDKGTISKITMNSKASSGVEKTGAFLSSVLPFVRAPKAASSQAPDAVTLAALAAGKPVAAEDMRAAYCLKKEIKKEIVGRVEDFR